MTESYVKSWYGNLKQNMSENVKFHLQSLCFFIFFCFFSLNCWILHPVATFPEKETVWLSDRWKDRKCKNMAEGILAYIMKTVKSWRTKDPQHSFHLSSSLNVLMELQQLHPHISSSSVTWWGIHSARYLCTLSPYQPKPLRPPSDRRTSPLVLNIWFPAVALIHWRCTWDLSVSLFLPSPFQYWIVVLCLYLFWKWQSNIHTLFTPWLEVSQRWTCLTLSTLSVSFHVNNQVEHF